jgi:hypothetical protein
MQSKIFLRYLFFFSLVSSIFTQPTAQLEDVITLPVSADFTSILGTAAQSPYTSAMFLGTNGGVIYRCAKNSSNEYTTSLCQVSLNITDRVLPTDPSFAQFGLLGMAFNENNLLDSKIYLGYTTPCVSSGTTVDCTYYRGLIRVSHFSRSDLTHYDPSSEFILFEAPTGANSSDRHVGGGMTLLPYNGVTTVLFGIGDNSPSPVSHPEQVYDECKLAFQEHRGDNARHYTLCGACPNNCTNPTKENYYGAVIALDANCAVQKSCKTNFSKVLLDNGSSSVAVAKGFRMPYAIEKYLNQFIITNVGESNIESIYLINQSNLIEGKNSKPTFAGWNIREGPFPFYYFLNTSLQDDRAPRPDLLLGSFTYTTVPYAYYNHTSYPGGLGNSIIGAFYHSGSNLAFTGIVAADYTPANQGGRVQRYFYVDPTQSNPGSRVKQFNVVNASAYQTRYLTRILGLGSVNAANRDVYMLTINVDNLTTTVTKLVNA